MPASPHVLFAGGGSASHLFPGMAVAEHLRRIMPNALVTFAGTGAARERHTVRIAGHHYSTIPTHPMPRNPLQAVRFVTDNVAGYCAARWMLREQRVSLVVGLGGSTSVAVVRAAVARGIPVVLLVQNAVPGRTTRWLSRAAAMVCAAFEEVRPHLHVQAPATVTGNPSRAAFEDRDSKLHGGEASGSLRAAARGATEHGRPVVAGAEGGSARAATGEGGSSGLKVHDPRRQRRLVILGG